MKQKSKDNLVYLGVAGVIVGILAFYIFYTDKTMGRIPEVPGAILWGILSTPAILALVLEQFWGYRRRYELWLILLVLTVANVSTVFIAYHLHWNPPVVEWSTLTGLGIIVVFVVTNKVLTKENNQKNGTPTRASKISRREE